MNSVTIFESIFKYLEKKAQLSSSFKFFNQVVLELSSVSTQPDYTSTHNHACIEQPKQRIKISVNMYISVLEFYGYIGNIGGYFYININKVKNNKNILKLIKIL